MHKKIYGEFERIAENFRKSNSILEIGATPSEKSLLRLSALSPSAKKTGINLDGPHDLEDFYVHKGDANDMSALFPDNSFDLVFCNAVLEHDKFFWRTLQEIHRVVEPGGWVVIGTPGYGMPSLERVLKKIKRLRLLKPITKTSLVESILRSTPTLPLHSWPGDYYRFSQKAFEEVFFAGLEKVEIKSFLTPPRFIGVGQMPAE